jgi:hypothetical protein
MKTSAPQAIVTSLKATYAQSRKTAVPIGPNKAFITWSTVTLRFSAGPTAWLASNTATGWPRLAAAADLA